MFLLISETIFDKDLNHRDFTVYCKFYDKPRVFILNFERKFKKFNNNKLHSVNKLAFFFFKIFFKLMIDFHSC